MIRIAAERSKANQMRSLERPAAGAEHGAVHALACAEVYGAGRGKVAIARVKWALAHVRRGNDLGHQEMEVRVALSVGVRDEVDRRAVDSNRHIRAVVGIEAAEEDLFCLAAACVLRDHEPGCESQKLLRRFARTQGDVQLPNREGGSGAEGALRAHEYRVHGERCCAQVDLERRDRRGYADCVRRETEPCDDERSASWQSQGKAPISRGAHGVGDVAELPHHGIRDGEFAHRVANAAAHDPALLRRRRGCRKREREERAEEQEASGFHHVSASNTTPHPAPDLFSRAQTVTSAVFQSAPS